MTSLLCSAFSNSIPFDASHTFQYYADKSADNTCNLWIKNDICTFFLELGLNFFKKKTSEKYFALNLWKFCSTLKKYPLQIQFTSNNDV